MLRRVVAAAAARGASASRSGAPAVAGAARLARAAAGAPGRPIAAATAERLTGIVAASWRRSLCASAASPEQTMESMLRESLGATHVVVVDISGGCGSMYRVEVVSPQFEGVSMVKQHRMVNAVLSSHIADMHGLTINTLTPAQHAKKAGAA
mmetsp:Transcript_36/g.125  ORF Transcript_36/g.125 Transcript_36/m.125 type:complete len:152 (-) Transcript_36:79-534(-)